MAATNKSLIKGEHRTAMTVKGMLEKNRGALMAALPKHVSMDRLMRVAVGAIARTPALQECTPESLFSAIVQSATLGLEPSGPLGEAYLVPFRNNKRGTKEVQFIPGYRGMISLSRRSGDVSLFYADVIRENDTYKIRRGTDPVLEHEICLGERGDPVAVYAVFKDKGGNADFEVMTPDDIEKIRARSKAKDSGPWITDYEEMAKKTVIRRLAKRAPMSVELAGVIDVDNRAAMGEDPDYSDVVDITGIHVEDAEAPVSQLESGGAKAAPPAAQKPAPKPQRQTPPAAKAPTPVDTPPPAQPAPEAPKTGDKGNAAPPPPEPKVSPADMLQQVKDGLKANKVTQKDAILYLIRLGSDWLEQGQGLADLDEEKQTQLVINMVDFCNQLKANTPKPEDTEG